MDVEANEDGTLLIIDDDDTRHVIDPNAIASWSKLLGYQDVVDTVDAILHVARNGEPPACPITGENAWTEDYLALQHVETAREDEAIKAVEEGTRDDPRSPRLRATLAARKANLEPFGATSESDSLLARTQKKARIKLGVLDPIAPPTSARGKRLSAKERPQTKACNVRSRALCDEGRRKVKECLEPALESLAIQQEKFCHSLTPYQEDPLASPDATAADGPEPLTDVNSLLARYKEDRDA